MAKKKERHQGWIGSFADHYFGHLENGKWIDISPLKYRWLKMRGFTVRVV